MELAPNATITRTALGVLEAGRAVGSGQGVVSRAFGQGVGPLGWALHLWLCCKPRLRQLQWQAQAAQMPGCCQQHRYLGGCQGFGEVDRHHSVSIVEGAREEGGVHKRVGTNTVVSLNRGYTL